MRKRIVIENGELTWMVRKENKFPKFSASMWKAVDFSNSHGIRDYWDKIFCVAIKMLNTKTNGMKAKVGKSAVPAVPSHIALGS